MDFFEMFSIISAQEKNSSTTSLDGSDKALYNSWKYKNNKLPIKAVGEPSSSSLCVHILKRTFCDILENKPQ